MKPEPKQTDDVAQLKQAVVALRKMRAKLDAAERSRTEPIAIIGMACSFPGGANDPELYWRVLRDGVDTVTEVPSNRWRIEDYYDPDPNAPGKSYARHGAFLDRDPAMFDAEFFGISAPEAESLDPQQRLLLETAWQALESAGQSPAKLAKCPTGVFMGLSNNDYSKLHLTGDPASINAYSGTGSHFSVAVGRLCYVLGLQGPNFPVDTACSSSLVTTHVACQSLRRGECRMALAGGVNLLLWPEGSVYFSKLRTLAADGRSKAFDADADGYVRGEGCGILVLKRLSDAQADGDRLLAVIRGSAINHNGKCNGLTAPNGIAQRAVIRAALADAGVEGRQIGYVEAHGTATSLGDAVELEAAGDVLGAGRTSGERFAMGAVKTNIGHLEAAAGAAALIKAVLSLQHRQIPAHLHFRKPNPHLSWDILPIRIPTATAPWTEQGKRIAGVSAFSYSGTNAHVIVEEAPEREQREAAIERPRHLLCLSARNETALRELANRYREYLETSTESLADICYTANTGRAHFAYRMTVAGSSPGEAAAKLLAAAVREPVRGKAPRVAAVMRNAIGVAEVLYGTQPAFRKAWDECRELLDTLPAGGASATHPAADFAAHYALWQMWRSWGVEPGAIWANGCGEFAAWWAAGVYSMRDALTWAASVTDKVAAKPAPARIPIVHGPDGLDRLRERDCGAFLELGHAAGNPADEWVQTIDTLASLYLQGMEINWTGFDRGYNRSLVALPTYPFQRKRYWPSNGDTHQEASKSCALIARRMQSPLVAETVFEAEWNSRWPLLDEHRVYGAAVAPGALFLTMALSAAQSIAGGGACTIENTVILGPLTIPDGSRRTVQLVLSPAAGGAAPFRIVSIDGTASWMEHASGVIRAGVVAAGDGAATEARARCSIPFDVAGFYFEVREEGMHVGDTFRWFESAWRGQGEAFCRLRDARPGEDEAQFRLHPGIIDTSFQLLRAAVPPQAGGNVFVPIAVDALRFQPGRKPRYCHARVRARAPETLTADIRILDDASAPVAELEGIQLKRASRDAMQRTVQTHHALETKPFRLEIGERGVLENLAFRPLTRTAPGPGEVEIRVVAAGLNFRDVLNALGIYPGNAGLLGGECSGVIAAAGPDVHSLRVGDPVIATTAGCFGSHVTLPAAYVVPKPAALSFEDAAAIPLAFITADYALNRLARIGSSDRILIHAATGGVGLAAVQLAQLAGAEIFATAGSEQKRVFLRECGVRHVMDSRSLEFAAQVREATEGQGVDVVLNSLAGEFIPTSLGLLRSNGRFIEIGKSGILTREQIAQLTNGIVYSAFDLIDVAMNHPALYRTMFLDTVERVAKGGLTPLARKDFAATDAIAAFRFMAQARHIGKIVISMAQTPVPAGAPAANSLGVAGATPSAASTENTEFLARLAKVSQADRRDMLSADVCAQANRVKGLAPAGWLDPQCPLKELGFDSLMAVELRNVLARRFALKLPASLVFDCPTIDALAGYLDERLFVAEPVAADPQRAENPEVNRILSHIEKVSDADVERLLLRRKLPQKVS
jgi:acyl transferase domain-containing protein